MVKNSPDRQPASLLMILGSGQVDAGLASVAGFVATAIAVRTLPADQLGVFALLFSAFAISAQLPAQLAFGPSEILIAHEAVGKRFGSLRWSLRRGLPVSAGASLFVAIGALPFVEAVDLSGTAPLVITAVVYSFISPVQDHVRRVLHTAERSPTAALVSGVNLAATVIAAAVLFQIGDLWVPFGSMAAGNAISVLVGVRGLRAEDPRSGVSMRELVRIGRFLLVVGLARTIVRYLVTIVVGWSVGVEAIGYAEAARLMARPAQVFSAGLTAALGPRLIVAGAAGDRPSAVHLTRVYYAAYSSVWLFYTALVAFPDLWSAPSQLFPAAYIIPGLVLATLASQFIAALSPPLRARLLGERREAKLARFELEAQATHLATLASVSLMGVFVIPFAGAVTHVVTLARYLGALHQKGSRNRSAA